MYKEPVICMSCYLSTKKTLPECTTYYKANNNRQVKPFHGTHLESLNWNGRFSSMEKIMSCMNNSTMKTYELQAASGSGKTK